MSVYDTYEPPESSGGLYLKFKDDEATQVRIVSPEPVAFESTFVNKKTNEETVSTKYAWIVLNRAIESAQVMQLPVTAYKKIAALARDQEYGDPTQYDLRITRTGVAPKIEYNITPGRTNSDITSAEREAASAIDLKKAISGGEGVNHVYYLSEVTNGPKPTGDKDLNTQKEILGVSDEDMSKPIDLKDIPF